MLHCSFVNSTATAKWPKNLAEVLWAPERNRGVDVRAIKMGIGFWIWVGNLISKLSVNKELIKYIKSAYDQVLPEARTPAHRS